MRRVLVAAIAALALLAFLAACDDVVEEGPTVMPPAGTPTATGGATPTPPGDDGLGGGELGPPTVVPPPTPSAVLPPVPEDWPTFANTKIVAFTFRYPSDWYAGPGSGTLSSWDPATWDKPWFPPNGVMLQVGVASVEKAEARPPEATDTLLVDIPGWEVVYTYDPTTSGGRARVHIVAADGERYRVQLMAAYAQENPDEAVFSQIVKSFAFSQ